MRLEQARVFFPGEEASKSILDVRLESDDLSSIIFFKGPEIQGQYTWRGIGQKIPQFTTVIGAAIAVCPVINGKRRISALLISTTLKKKSNGIS